MDREFKVLSLNELMAKMERITEFTPAWDRRDPDPNKNYGIHGVELRMVLKGKLGAVQFVLYTNWYLPHIQKELSIDSPIPADLGYHSPTPKYSDQPARDNCPYLDGAPCYYDGSGLNAQRIYDVLLTKGSDGVWKELEDYYIELFGSLI